MDECMDGWMDESMDGWMNVWPVDYLAGLQAGWLLAGWLHG